MIITDLFHIGLLIVFAKLAEGVLQRFGISSIVAYTLAGLILGPVTGLIEPHAELNIFLGIGVFVFFFLIGLDEVDIPGFVSTIRGRFFVAATISVAISLLAAMAVTSDLLRLDFALNLEFSDALALSGILSLSSLGLVAKVLADGGHLKEPVGLEIFTTVIIAELLALLLVGFTLGEHSFEPNVLGVLRLIGQIGGFAVVAWLLSSRILPPVIVHLQRVLEAKHLSFGLLLGGLFLVVVAAETIGLHGSIGALLFGAALSGIPSQIRNDVMPGLRSTAEGLFVPLFFASAGLYFDLSFIHLPALTIAAIVVVPILGKFAGAFIGTFIARLDQPVALATGLMAKGVAEIALLLLLLEFHVIGHDVFSLLVLIMFGYILLMPSAITFVVRRARLARPSKLPSSVPPSFARYALEGVTVGNLMDPSKERPGASLTVHEFSEDWLVPNQHDYIVIDDGQVRGIVSLARLRFVPKRKRRTTQLRNVLRLQPPHAFPDEAIEDVLERMYAHSLTILPVLGREDMEFLGSVAHRDVTDFVELRYEVDQDLEERARETSTG